MYLEMPLPCHVNLNSPDGHGSSTVVNIIELKFIELMIHWLPISLNHLRSLAEWKALRCILSKYNLFKTSSISFCLGINFLRNWTPKLKINYIIFS